MRLGSGPILPFWKLGSGPILSLDVLAFSQKQEYSVFFGGGGGKKLTKWKLGFGPRWPCLGPKIGPEPNFHLGPEPNFQIWPFYQNVQFNFSREPL